MRGRLSLLLVAVPGFRIVLVSFLPAGHRLPFQPLFPGPFAHYPPECAVANPASVDVQAGSWGALKSAAD